MKRQSLSRSEGVVFCMAYLVESLTIIIGNLIIITVFTRTRRLRNRRKYHLLLNLAVADLLVGAIAVPSFVCGLSSHFDLWDAQVDYQTFVVVDNLVVFTTCASFVNLITISLERMYATLWPLKHRLLRARTYHVLAGLSWTVSIYAISLNMAQQYYVVSSFVYLYIWLSFICCSLLVIFASYISIWIKTKFGQQSRHHVTTAQDRKLTVSLFLVTAVSLVTILPSPVTNAVFLPIGLTPSFLRTHYSTMLLLFANSLVNPIIYAFRMPQFRHAAVQLVCRRPAERRELIRRANLKKDQACVLTSNHSKSNLTKQSYFDTRL